MMTLPKINNILIILISIMILGCSAASGSPAEIPISHHDDSFMSFQNDFKITGASTLEIDRTNLSAELIPLRKAAITDVLEVVDITGYLITEPCLNCAKISKVGLDADENIVVTIGIRHPMAAGNPLQAITWKNRADLHVFNMEGIIISNEGETISFPALTLNSPPQILTNASGYSSYLDDVLDEDMFQTAADIHPYILHFADYSNGNFNPSSPTGFESVTNPHPSGNLVMPMGSDYDFRDYIFNIPDSEMSFLFVTGCTYGLSCLSFYQRFLPEYRIPQHLKKAASEVHVSPIAEKLQELNPSATAKLRIEAVDPSHGVAVGSALNEMAYDSSVKSVEIEIPGVLDGTWTQAGDDAISGTGHDPSNPLVYEFNIFNELTAPVGTYPGIVKVTDNYPTGMNQSIFLQGSDGLKRVAPNSNPLDGIFQIPELATYATFKIEVELGTPVEQHIYDVGPGYSYADPSEVPWESLEPNTLVRIHYRTEPYADKWVIARTGLPGQPIIVRGIPDGDKLPIITGENAKTRLELDYWNEKRSVLKIGGASFPNEFPRYITIEYLDIRSAHPNYSFTDDNGNTDTYGDNAASVHIEEGEYITLRGCILHDSGNGLFVTNLSSDVLVDGNYIYDNGNTASAYEHNSYTECKGITFQFNHYGPLKTGSLGNNLKDRSAGTVIRYNWIETGSRMCDLVDSHEPTFVSDPRYRETFVYGNILIKTDLDQNGGVIHYGGDSGTLDDYRKGTLWFYNNTIVSYRTSRTTLYQISTNDEKVECFNNILYDNVGGNNLYIMDSAGVVNLYNNWISTGWHEVNGVPTGTINVWDNIDGIEPGFADFPSQDFHLLSTSPCRNAALALPSAILPDNALLFQYVKHLGQEDRPDDSSLDIGAFEFE